MSPKEELVSVMSTASPVGVPATESIRSSVLELLAKLEPTNPTEAPATSPLLNGVWDVVYSGYAPGPLKSPTRPLALFLYAGGYTPGIASLNILRMFTDVGGLELTISRDQPRVEAATTVALVGSQQLKVFTDLEPETAIRLKETYSSFKVGERNVDIPARFRYTRKIFVTYLDDDVMIVRDDSGVPDILLRKAMPDFLVEPQEDSPPQEEVSTNLDV